MSVFEDDTFISTTAAPPRPQIDQKAMAEWRDGEMARQRSRAREDLVRQLLAVEGGRGGYVEEGVELWAHCGNVNAGCIDDQVRVIGKRITLAHTYRDGGDDGPNADRVENSWTEYAFATAEEAVCEHCGADRVIGEQKRPAHEHKSGFDQRGLLKLAREWANGAPRNDLAGVSVPGAPTISATPEETLKLRFANGEIEADEYRARLAVLSGEAVPSTVSTTVDTEPDAPEGIRQRGEKWQAMWRDVEGKQRSATFATIEEAVAGRANALEARA